MPAAADSLHVLIVEDEATICDMLTELLTAEGHAVEVVGDVAGAVSALAAASFDLLMLDKNLPDGTGLEVAQHVKQRSLDCDMVMMTAYGNLESAVDAMRLGITEYMAKPFATIDAPRACVRRVSKLRALKLSNRQLIDDLQEKNALLEEMTVRDPLTQLFNHAFMQDSLEREVQRAQRHGLEFSLLFIDLDNFKQINDASGHTAGDQVLKVFSEMLAGGARRADIGFRLRQQDIAARYGGDEFALLLPETPKRGASVKAERLRELVASWDASSIGLPAQSISVGVAAFPTDAPDRAGLIAAADAALYAAKRSGRNRIVAYSEALPQFAARGGEVLAEEIERFDALDRSIENSDFDFVYQPIVHASSGEVYAYEALCRPKDPIFPHPGVLFSTAENGGRIRDLGRVIRAGAIRGIESLPADALLFINLHPDELHDPQLVAIEPHLAPWASRVILEVTEVASIKDTARLKITLSRLKEAGFRVALDDLGSGYSSLNSLAMIEPDFVKLDMGLVRRINVEARTRRLAKHIIEYASEEGMQVVAEGIETQEEQQALVELGCPLLQGFYFGKGVPVSEIAAGR